MKKLAIIGAGISGLTLANLLKEKYSVVLFESSGYFGGIARTKSIGGKLFHTTGGHCFNSIHGDVLEWVFKNILPEDNWNLIERKAAIYFRNNLIRYPIEYSIKEIFTFDQDLAVRIVKDFLSAEGIRSSNLREWFINNFGQTLAEEYLIPYNEKIWKLKTSEMSPEWVKTKLPLPDKESFIRGILDNSSDKMPHRSFFYPKSNDQLTFLNALAEKVLDSIRFNTSVTSVVKLETGWDVNGEYFDVLVSTAPLNKVGSFLQNIPEDVIINLNKLKYNRVTTMLWENDGSVTDTWTYFPGKEHLSHRHIHIGNFLSPKQNTTIVEVIGVCNEIDMIENCKEIPYLLRPLAYHVSDHAYVVYDSFYEASTSSVKKYLNQIGLYTLGRFGEWEYYNMDVCIKQAMNLSKVL